MKKIIILSILLTLIFFTSCDGKDRARTSLEEKIANKDLPSSFFEKTEYFPKEYIEVISDTLINNGFRVEIKTFSDMNNSYIREFVKDRIKYKEYYRDFLSSITIWKDNKEVFFNTVDRDFFETRISSNKELNDMTFHNVWLDDETSTFTNTIVLNSLFCKPKTNECVVYKMIIDETGYFTLKEDN